MTELSVEVVKVKLKMQRFGSVVSSINTLKALMKLALCRCSRVYRDVRQQNPDFLFLGWDAEEQFCQCTQVTFWLISVTKRSLCLLIAAPETMLVLY